MSQASRAYVPAATDEAVKAKTGKDWAGWFGILDQAGATKLKHAAIATLLREVHAVPSWWSQMVTVEYERARGLRVPHQTSKGFTVSASKTIAASAAQLYAACATAAKRRQWFPKGTFEPSSQVKKKSLRGAWNGSARLEIGFYAKSAGKAQMAIAVSKLAKESQVEHERAAWKAALARLQTQIERRRTNTP